MKKTLYSLMLNDEVVREVDALAHRLGTNRSSLINEILAEYVDYKTPERRVQEILSAIETLMRPDAELVPFFAPHTDSLSLKSSLEYKYRPTIKYEVELGKTGDGIGTLSVLFRTQSPALIREMTEFFRLWTALEEQYLEPQLGPIGHALYEGRFCRSLKAPSRSCTSDELAEAMAGYIRLFDRLMKGALAGRFNARDVEAEYVSFLKNASILF